MSREFHNKVKGMEYLIHGKYLIVTPKKIVKDGGLVVEGDRVIEVGDFSQLRRRYGGYEKLGGERKVIMPGLINTHTHAAMTLFRGYADDMELNLWLTKKIWPLEAKLKGSDVYIGTLLACLEMIKTGTTTFSDMYFFMDEVVKAVKETGLRAVISHGMIELGSEEKGKKELKESERIIKKFNGALNGRLKVFLGPHSPYTCSPKFLEEVTALAEEYNVGVHIHVAETKDEIGKIKKAFHVKIGSEGVVGYLDKLKILGKKTLAAHVVWVTEEEINTLKRRGVKVSHNPVSNLKLASGFAPIPKMLNKEVTVSLGTDGAASNNSLNMFETMKVTALIHKGYFLNPTVLPAWKVLELATLKGAEALSLKKVGSLEKGSKADLIILDLDKPSLTPVHNIISQIVYSVKGSEVTTVMVDGEILLENREFTKLNEQEILEKGQATAEDLLTREGGS